MIKENGCGAELEGNGATRPSIRVGMDARYIRETPSGIGTYTQALVDRLPHAGASDQFIFWRHRLAPCPLSPGRNTMDITVRPGPTSPLPVFWPRHYAPFGEIDVFHSPNNMMPRGLPCPAVITVHDVMAIERPEFHMQGLEQVAKKWYCQQALWRALRGATRLIVPTKATADRIYAIAPDAAARVRVIWEAAEPSFAPAEDQDGLQKRAFLLTGSAAPYLLLVGANTPAKRHSLAMAAFAAKVPMPWRLVLLQRRRAGKGLRSLASDLGIAHRVVWLNAVAHQDVVTLLQAAGALIHPSVYEGFGLPILEAMACGCPVVASDIPPFREITARATVLFPPDNLPALATALSDVVRSPERRRSLSEHGLARARDFSWDRAARETLEVYHDATSAGGIASRR